MIYFYTSPTPNGWKVAIVLEEMELVYTWYVLNLSERTQPEKWFLKMNPNGHILVIVDHDNKDDLIIFLRLALSCCIGRRKVGSSCGRA
jgi:GST-like protein